MVSTCEIDTQKSSPESLPGERIFEAEF
jgi:hypothetical protein